MRRFLVAVALSLAAFAGSVAVVAAGYIGPTP